MKTLFARVAAAAVAASAISTVALAAPAGAVTCASAYKYTARDIANSAKFDATSACDGVYAGTAASFGDQVRGRFYKDGSWQFSTYSWVKVFTYEDGWDKIIGNTITGRDIKGQALNRAQNVSYLY